MPDDRASATRAPASVRSTHAEVVLSMQHDKLGHPFLCGAFDPRNPVADVAALIRRALIAVKRAPNFARSPLTHTTSGI
ncbi:hypothetical protein [Burkholderia sp. ABCPW 14]|uniref:hypothetical protein n=1 Tax=Burkholderia sp. ABCPW 14 TaxID=1637860 RepID=UPI0012E393ED|nr:hypothetical protein [Burkholderia sp. ABCPW 14]